MPINQDTHYVIKNGIVEQPAVVKDGLELYYDAKGKHNSDVHKGTLLDLSGNNRHGTLVNFAYEGVSGYQENGTGGILLDDVDDKIVRPAIPNIQYASASRNIFESIQTEWESGTFSNYLTDNVVNTTRIRQASMSYALELNTTYTVSVANGYVVNLNVNSVNMSYAQSLTFTPTSNNGLVRFVIKRVDEANITTAELITAKFQLEKNSIASNYTPYIPLPIITYQLNGNILSFEKDGTVKRITKDGDGSRITVSRKGINLVSNGNFYNGASGWQYGTIKAISHSENSAELEVLNPGSQWIQPSVLTSLAATNGHKIYACLYTTNTSNESSTNLMINAGVTQTLTSSGKREGWTKLEGITTLAGQNNGQLIRMYNGHIFSSAEVSIGQRFFIKNFQIIDLTEAYGAGNEPDLTYIQAHPEEFSWTPNPNDLIQTMEIKNNLVGDLENLQGNDFEQHEDGVITYTNEAEEGSVVRVDIDGISEQPLRFRSAQGEQLVITEHDTGDSIKKIEFCGNSVQAADKYREVSGTSVTIAPELHDKTVADKVVISGNTTQYTETSNVVTDDLVMWLSGRNFANTPATTVWKDLTGANNGTASGFAYTTASGSDGNGGVVFDGIDDLSNCGSSLIFKSNLTFDAIVKVPSPVSAVRQHIIGRNLHFYLTIEINGKVRAHIHNSGSWRSVESTTTLNANTVYHLTATYNGSFIKIYINGVFNNQLSNSGVLSSPSEPLYLGIYAGGSRFTGTIYSARIYDRTLSDAEILQNYNAGVAIPIPNIAMPQEVKHVNNGNKILTHGKNFCNESLWFSADNICLYAADGKSGTLAGWKTIIEYIPVLPNTTYTLSFLGVKGHIFEYDSNKDWLSPFMTNVSNPKTFTTKATTRYVRLTWEDLTVHNIQLEQGSAATTYTPYVSTETTIPVTLKSIG